MLKISDLATLKTIFHSLIKTHYLSHIICIGVHKNFVDNILILSKKAITIIVLKRSEAVNRLFAELNILTVYIPYVLESIKYVGERCSNRLFKLSDPSI